MSEKTVNELCGPTGPAPEHALLLRNVGEWEVACQYFNPGMPEPLTATATENVVAVGGFWTTSDFNVSFGSFKLNGRATIGYDPTAKKHVSFWIDSGNPWPHRFEGNRNPETGTLELRGENPDPGTGIMTKFRTEERWLGPDSREFTMWYQPPGHPELKLAFYRYARKK